MMIAHISMKHETKDEPTQKKIPWFRFRKLRKPLTMELIPLFILSVVVSKEPTCLRSGELARLTGVSKDTLRHYERIGVLMAPERTDSRYRLYPQSAVRRVLIVRAALDIGISLRDLQEIFALRESGQRPCEDVRKLAHKRLEAVVGQIEVLTHLRNRLVGLLRDWDERLGDGSSEKLAHLLETLVPEETDSEEE